MTKDLTHDFDAQRKASDAEPMTFRLRGDTYTTRATLGLGTMQRLADGTSKLAPLIDGVNTDDDDYEPTLAESAATGDLIGLQNEFVMGCLDEPSAKLWREACDRGDDPITADDLGAVMGWLVEGLSARPT